MLTDVLSHDFSYRFNSGVIPKHDVSLHATSRRYGTRTMLDTAPNHQPEDYHTTTTRNSYKAPSVHDRPNWRNRNNSLTFETCAKLQVHKRSDTNASGYESNRQLWDGTHWVNEKNVHTDMMRTSYRNNFNVAKPFHKDAARITDGRLKRKELFFDGGDNRPTLARLMPKDAAAAAKLGR